jgi:FixJ family two-component response regulator
MTSAHVTGIMMQRPSVYIVDDDALVRLALRRVISRLDVNPTSPTGEENRRFQSFSALNFDVSHVLSVAAPAISAGLAM